MSFVKKQFHIEKEQRVFRFLMDTLDISLGQAQKYIDKGRVFYEGKVLEYKGAIVKGDIEVVVFEANPIGLKPTFENEDFAVFDKPSGVLVHPRKRDDSHTLSDDIKYLYGASANTVHRIDKETSGLVVAAKNKVAEKDLKMLFEHKRIYKEYVALAFGYISQSIVVDAPLKIVSSSSRIKLKVHVSQDGKESQTKITPLRYDAKRDMTLVKAIPMTGRQHQIRVHLFHVKHPIVGDPIYGMSEENTNLFLRKELSEKIRSEKSGAKRLLLHAKRVSFEYKNEEFDIISQFDYEKAFDGALDEQYSI